MQHVLLHIAQNECCSLGICFSILSLDVTKPHVVSVVFLDNTALAAIECANAGANFLSHVCCDLTCLLQHTRFMVCYAHLDSPVCILNCFDAFFPNIILRTMQSNSMMMFWTFPVFPCLKA